MPVFQVKVPPRWYSAIVERGILEHILKFMPAQPGKVFVVSNEDVWRLHGERLRAGLGALSYDVLFLPAGEEQKRLARATAAITEDQIPLARIGPDDLHVGSGEARRLRRDRERVA